MILGGQTITIFHSSALPVIAPPVVREERQIIVNGAAELWRLEWETAPKPACGAEGNSDSITCPCSGFAYGESGQLDLVRVAAGHEIERLKLTPYFEDTPTEGGHSAVVQRWELQSKDNDEAGSKEFAAQVSHRPVVNVMQFADYNHDGMATEFFLQTESLPCGKHAGIVIGLTRAIPRLHVFGTVLHPDKPLVLQKTEWDSLLKRPGGGETLDWACGDHGSDVETYVELHASNGNIQGIRRNYKCTEDGKRGSLQSEKPF